MKKPLTAIFFASIFTFFLYRVALDPSFLHVTDGQYVRHRAIRDLIEYIASALGPTGSLLFGGVLIFGILVWSRVSTKKNY